MFKRCTSEINQANTDKLAMERPVKRQIYSVK